MGLGNPGPRYARTRHNVGFRVVDALARRLGIEIEREAHGGRIGAGRLGDEELLLLAPQTWMNRSGLAVESALRSSPEASPARDLLVVYDDLDLPLGRIRVRPSGGASGHRGMESVIDEIGTRDFPRLRFGIGRPADAEADVVAFVLDPFTPEEEERVCARVEDATLAALTAIEEGARAAMDRFNHDSDAAPQAEPEAGEPG